MTDFSNMEVVYFWYAEVFSKDQNGHIVKIGRSKNVCARDKEIRTCSPHRCWQIWCLWSPGMDSYSVERLIHENLARYRTHGEWFKIGTLEKWGLENSLTTLVPGTKFELAYESDADDRGITGGYFPSEYPPGYFPSEYPQEQAA